METECPVPSPAPEMPNIQNDMLPNISVDTTDQIDPYAIPPLDESEWQGRRQGGANWRHLWRHLWRHFLAPHPGAT